MNVRRLGSELKKFGPLEVAYRKLYKRSLDPMMHERMLQERDKGYLRFTPQEMERELCYLYQRKIGHELDLKNPKSFTEKIQWLKLYDCTPEKTRLADKFQVRNWVANVAGRDIRQIPLLGVWKDFDEIDFDALPNRFCLKMNHGSGMNYVVTDKNSMNRQEARERFKCWEREPFHVKSLEFQYRDIPKRILAEVFMGDQKNSLEDYKFHCFHGEPAFVHYIGGRDIGEQIGIMDKHSGFLNAYDMEWNRLDWTFENFPQSPSQCPKPASFDRMKELACILSAGFRYVRVDLYEIEGEIYFGEMTFTPASGFYPYRRSWTRSRDEELGCLLKLPTDRRE